MSAERLCAVSAPELAFFAGNGALWLLAFLALRIFDSELADSGQDAPSARPAGELPAGHPPTPRGAAPCASAATQEGVRWPFAHLMLRLHGSTIIVLAVVSSQTPLAEHPIATDAVALWRRWARHPGVCGSYAAWWRRPRGRSIVVARTRLLPPLALLVVGVLNYALFAELVLPVGALLVLLPALAKSSWHAQCAVFAVAAVVAASRWTQIAAALSMPPFVPTPTADLEAILAAASDELLAGERNLFVELGCGDGRNLLLAATHGGFARAVGVESSPFLVLVSRARVWWHGLDERVSVQRADMLVAALPQPPPSAIYLYLSHALVSDLAPRLVCAYGGAPRPTAGEGAADEEGEGESEVKGESEGGGGGEREGTLEQLPLVFSRDFELPAGWGEPIHTLQHGRTVLRSYRLPRRAEVDSVPLEAVAAGSQGVDLGAGRAGPGFGCADGP